MNSPAARCAHRYNPSLLLADAARSHEQDAYLHTQPMLDGQETDRMPIETANNDSPPVAVDL